MSVRELAAAHRRSLAWWGDDLVDWLGGWRIARDGAPPQRFGVVAIAGTPRVIELATGRTVHRWDGVDGGAGLHQPSVSMSPPAPPWLAADATRKRFALGWPDRVVVVS